MSHYRMCKVCAEREGINILCRECGIRISGCRCPEAHKHTRLGICRDCEVRLDMSVQDDEDQVLGDNIVLGEE